jgi:UDP-N-acetylmuramoyl-tripeptide--D-alanyl-D-alanine ligase
VHAVLSVAASIEFCAKEVSGHPPSEITGHSKILRPHIVIVTTIGGDHYKTFRGPEAAADTRAQLVANLPSHATAILNADDAHVRAMANRTRARIVTFGFSSDAEVKASACSSVWPDRLALTVTHGHETAHIQTRLVGEHWATSVLAAIACGTACGLDLNTSAKIVEMFRPLFGRYSVHVKPGGPAYILDTSKAPFWTIANGLSFLSRARAPRKTAVFGTISDYPGAASRRYRRVAREALEVADRVLFVGAQAGHVNKLCQNTPGSNLLVFHSTHEASAFLAEESEPDELVFIKASRRDHLERIMFSQIKGVVCWRERCGKRNPCHRCSRFRKPYAPPIGIAKVVHEGLPGAKPLQLL